MIMSATEDLDQTFVSIEVNHGCTEAVLLLADQTRLCFSHKVGERWAKAVGPEGTEEQGGQAAEILAAIALFRLNAKHLDISFADGSRWEKKFRAG
jgi:hypothetical protein